MKNFSIKKVVTKQRGQGMMEYIIIVALIAVAAIGVYSTFGKAVRNQTAGMAKEIAGNDAANQIKAAASAATSAGDRADKNKSMADYNDQNDQK